MDFGKRTGLLRFARNDVHKKSRHYSGSSRTKNHNEKIWSECTFTRDGKKGQESTYRLIIREWIRNTVKHIRVIIRVCKYILIIIHQYQDNSILFPQAFGLTAFDFGFVAEVICFGGHGCWLFEKRGCELPTTTYPGTDKGCERAGYLSLAAHVFGAPGIIM